MSARENAIGIYHTGIRDGRPEEAMATFTGAQYRQHSTGVGDGQEGFVAFFTEFLARNPKRDIHILRALQDGRQVFLQAYQSLNDGEAQWVTADMFDSDDEGRIIEHWDVIGEYVADTGEGRSNVDGPTEVTDLDRTDANKNLVREFYQTCLIGGDTTKASEFVDQDRFIEHGSAASEGSAAPSRGLGQMTYTAVDRLVGEGNFVAVLSHAEADGQALCAMDLFRVEAGLIAEHWPLSEPIPPRDEWTNSGKF